MKYPVAFSPGELRVIARCIDTVIGISRFTRARADKSEHAFLEVLRDYCLRSATDLEILDQDLSSSPFPEAFSEDPS